LLNLGHTVGHALESWSHAEGKPLWHGEAIAIGLVYAVALSVASGKMTHSRAKKIMTTIRQYFPDLSLDATDWQQLQPWLQHDKKKKGGVITWVLPERPGRVDFGVTLPNPVWMEAAFETTQQYFPAS
jgi:3-dehydroquinate synthase